MSEPEYYIVGLRPVKLVPSPDGSLAVLKLNPVTGTFEFGTEYFPRVRFGTDDIEQVSEDDFIQRVEALRARRLAGEGPLFALYQLINAIEDVAEEEGRELASDEQLKIAELRRQTHAMFQAEHPDPE